MEPLQGWTEVSVNGTDDLDRTAPTEPYRLVRSRTYPQWSQTSQVEIEGVPPLVSSHHYHVPFRPESVTVQFRLTHAEQIGWLWLLYEVSVEGPVETQTGGTGDRHSTRESTSWSGSGLLTLPTWIKSIADQFRPTVTPPQKG